MDIINFLSDIPHQLGRLILARKIPGNITLKISLITDVIELMVNNNTFQFDNKNCFETQGTAMETEMAPTYVPITQAHLEENLCEIIGKITAAI